MTFIQRSFDVNTSCAYWVGFSVQYFVVILIPYLSLLREDCRFNEVVFVLDVSQTIEPSAYKQLKKFTVDIIFKVHQSRSDTSSSSLRSRVGVVTFADRARKRIYCDEYTSRVDGVERLNKAIYSLERPGGEIFTNIRDGLVKAKQLLFERGCGENDLRPGTHRKVLVLISDGRANMGHGGKEGIYKEALDTRRQGITILAVAVGNMIATDMLQRIVGEKKYYVTGKTLHDVFDNTIVMMDRELCSPTVCKYAEITS